MSRPGKAKGEILGDQIPPSLTHLSLSPLRSVHHIPKYCSSPCWAAGAADRLLLLTLVKDAKHD